MASVGPPQEWITREALTRGPRGFAVARMSPGPHHQSVTGGNSINAG